jgi:8-oxo-dGTP pyrophosphatase MutT (NUDIX family)
MDAASPSGPEKIGPWTRISSRAIYENPWIRVREDQILRPDGSPGIYGVVEFRNLAVGVVPVDQYGRVILVGQYRYPLRVYSWEIPEGGCPKEEDTPLESAARELREETGFTAGRWDYLGCLALSNSVSDEVGHLFLARELTPGASHPEPSEELRLKTLDLELAHRMVLEGELTESMTVAGLVRARHFLEREKSGLPGKPYPDRL